MTRLTKWITRNMWYFTGLGLLLIIFYIPFHCEYLVIIGVALWILPMPFMLIEMWLPENKEDKKLP